MTEKIERLTAVMHRTGLCKTQLYELINAREFPAPVHLTTRARGWLASEVDQWIAGRKAERDARRAASC